LEALERLCRSQDGEQIVTLLRHYAPTWLLQLPAFLTPAEQEELQRQLLNTTQERMLREIARALEALTADRPLVLWLEDLHWSDLSTLDLLSFLARRLERARLMVLGTYRPADVLARAHPLRAIKQELQLHSHCEDLALRLLTATEVAEYLGARFAVQMPILVQNLGMLIHQRTEGNPLFMVNVAAEFVAQGLLKTSDSGETHASASLHSLEELQIGVPATIQQMIELQFDRLSSADQQVLEVASVAGAEFSAAAVAAGIGIAVAAVEAQCAGLARHEQFLRAQGVSEWPDGTVAARYSFLHTLYQEVLYERVTPGRRASLHRRIGEREESAYGKRSREIAAELAAHFERGQDYGRAVQYLRRAGENAGRRLAYREAIQYLTKALELLKTLPDTPERSGQELTLQIALGMPLMATKGYAAPEVERIYARARELCQHLEEPPQLFRVLHGLWGFYFVRAELQTARELGEQLLRLAQRVPDPMLLLHAHNALGSALCWMGEVALARQYLEQGVVFSHSLRPSPSAFVQDPGVLCLGFLAWTLWSLGYPDQTVQQGHEALGLAQELAHPFSRAFALNFAAEFHQLRREGRPAQARAEEVIALSREHGFLQWAMEATITRGWALAEQSQGREGIAQIRQGLAARRTAGAELGRPYHLALLAEAYAKEGQVEEGLQSLAEALGLVDTTSERFYEAELYRLQGELILQLVHLQNPRDGETRIG
jgi:predicted ATPase